jgi:SNF2 family DNA or RNA helicase
VKYRFKRRPYAHQKDAIRKLVSTGFGGALLMAPRTGKTKTVIDYACIMHEAGYINRVLISCPVAVMSVWEDEIAANVPDRIKYSVTVWDKQARKEVDLPKWGKDRLDFVIINHDAFSTAGAVTKRVVSKRTGKTLRLVRSKKRGGRYEMKREFSLWQPQLLVVDESHRFKSPSSAKFRTLVSLVWEKDGITPKIPFRVLMTGTPITKKKRIFDIYAQWKLLNPKRFRGMTLKDFKHHYARWVNKGNYEMWVANRPKEVESLRELIHKDSFAITRDECFDLPKSSQQIIHVSMSEDTALAYDQMAEEMVAKLKSGELVEASIKLVMTMRLAQISSGVGKTSPTPEHPDGQLIRIGTDKMDVLESLLSDLFEADEKVVVAARFSHDIKATQEICDRLSTKTMKVHHFTLQGRRKGPRQDRKSRAQDLKRFKNIDGPACYIVQPASGSMGIDLSSASTIIWFSLTPSWVDYTQMNDRIALNPHSVSEIYLIASPADQLLYDTLLEDGDLAKAVTDSPDRLLRNYKK